MICSLTVSIIDGHPVVQGIESDQATQAIVHFNLPIPIGYRLDVRLLGQGVRDLDHVEIDPHHRLGGRYRMDPKCDDLQVLASRREGAANWQPWFELHWAQGRLSIVERPDMAHHLAVAYGLETMSTVGVWYYFDVTPEQLAEAAKTDDFAKAAAELLRMTRRMEFMRPHRMLHIHSHGYYFASTDQYSAQACLEGLIIGFELRSHF